MMYAPRNEFCMIWVIFWMPTDQVMTFLCFISDSQWVDMSGQGWGGGRGHSGQKSRSTLPELFKSLKIYTSMSKLNTKISIKIYPQKSNDR